MKMPHAVFLVALRRGEVAAVRRPDGRIGLPGGKIDPGETALAALARRSRQHAAERLG